MSNKTNSSAYYGDDIYYDFYNSKDQSYNLEELTRNFANNFINTNNKAINKLLKKFDGSSSFVDGIYKINDFLTNDKGYGSIINKGLDTIGGLIKEPPGYSGRYGSLLLGIDKTWDSASDALMAIPGYGTALGMGMKALGVLNKGIQRLGGGTDGMTKTDAWLSSSLLGWTPLGMINGFGGKKANTYTRNQELDALSAAGFGGFLSLQNTTALGAGKKYGLFSSGARDKLNLLTEYTLGVKHTVSGIVDFNTLNNMASMGTTLFAAQQLNIDLNGGIHNLRAARQGLKLKPIKLPKFKQKFYDDLVFKTKLGTDWQATYVGKVKTGVPSVLSTAQKQGLAPIPTMDGEIVYMLPDGTFSYKPLRTSLYAKNGVKFAIRVNKKYQLNNYINSHRQGGKTEYRGIKEASTGQTIGIPTRITNALKNGQEPIKTNSGRQVIMLADGLVMYVEAARQVRPFLKNGGRPLKLRILENTKEQDDTSVRNLLPFVNANTNARRPAYKKGGKMNVIPEGALHARKNHLTDVDNIYKLVTHKGIPIITIEDNGEVVQHAEVEHSEIIFTKEVTDLIEKYREEGTDEAALACGKLLVKEILYNTDDRSGVMQTVE